MSKTRTIWMSCRTCGGKGKTNVCPKCGEGNVAFHRHDGEQYDGVYKKCPSCYGTGGFKVTEKVTGSYDGEEIWDTISSRPSSKNDGCFVTTAAAIAIGKSDECTELKTFRKYRDEWLIFFNHQAVLEYYRIAPLIVRSIDALPNSKKIYEDIWRTYIVNVYELILNQSFEDAFLEYKKAMIDLYEKFSEKAPKSKIE